MFGTMILKYFIYVCNTDEILTIEGGQKESH